MFGLEEESQVGLQGELEIGSSEGSRGRVLAVVERVVMKNLLKLG